MIPGMHIQEFSSLPKHKIARWDVQHAASVDSRASQCSLLSGGLTCSLSSLSVLAILGSLLFHTDFKTSLLRSIKSPTVIS
jgi:hypothetical protein